tara:strand:+ start:2844 stop:3476 length:633 start_codon:yes stop_codon:yes gene_type:complete
MIRVYVAEDEVLLRDFVDAFFKGEPTYELVGFARDGQEAYEACSKLKPELVILDVMLPKLNGIEVLERLKKELPNTKVLVCSSIQSPKHMQRILKAQADGFLEKGSGLQAFSEAVHQVASGRSYFSPQILEALRDMALNPEFSDSLADLTAREREILQRIAEGATNKAIAESLGLKLKTVETHRANLMRKVGAHNAADLTRFAVDQGLIQ